jgi:site-specific recombinase XerD
MPTILNDQELSLVHALTHKHKSRTAHSYMREISNFKKFIEKDLSDAHPSDCAEYISFLRKKKKASSSIQTYYHQLFSFYNYLFENKIIQSNPFALIDKPKASKQIKATRTPSPEDLKKLLNAVQSEFETRDYAIILLIATTGLKINQVLSIKWSDFIIDDKDHIGVKIGYDESTRYIRILNQVWQQIELYRQELMIPTSYCKENYFVFISNRERDKYKTAPSTVKPISADWIRKVLERSCTYANIPLYTSKDLRHAHAVYALRLGASTEDVADQLGWNHPNLVYRYVGVIEQILHPANKYTEVFFKDILSE